MEELLRTREEEESSMVVGANNMRSRPYNKTLVHHTCIARTVNVNERDFLTRMLYKDCY